MMMTQNLRRKIQRISNWFEKDRALKVRLCSISCLYGLLIWIRYCEPVFELELISSEVVFI